jgi:cysteine synthase
MLVEDGIVGCIGQTPLLRLGRLRPPGGAEIVLKLEGWNASGSVKTRAAANMVRAATERGDRAPGQAVVEPSSGNLGIALAAYCASQDIRCSLVLDPRTTGFSDAVMNAYGARVERVTEPDERGSWQGSRLAKARRIVAEEGAFLCYQYGNPDNPAAHYAATGREVVEQLGRVPDVCVVGVSTGGQISGIGGRLKEAGPCRMVAVDVEGSSIFGGSYQAYRLRGLGLSWWPDNLNPACVDVVYRIHEALAFQSARLLARTEGVFSGGAAGAIIAAAYAQAASLTPESTVVAIIPERGDRYLRQLYDDDWLADLGYEREANAATWIATCRSLAPLPEADWRRAKP